MNNFAITNVQSGVDNPQRFLSSKEQYITRLEFFEIFPSINNLPVFKLLGSIPFENNPVQEPDVLDESAAIDHL